MDGFERLAAAFADRDGVTLGGEGGRGFGATALQVDGHIFAMPNAAGLALKLPASRVATLIAAGDGLPFDAGKGRPMREWVVITSALGDRWQPLAEEALAFVRSSGPKR